jgi:hypothetical protein
MGIKKVNPYELCENFECGCFVATVAASEEIDFLREFRSMYLDNNLGRIGINKINSLQFKKIPL